MNRYRQYFEHLIEIDNRISLRRTAMFMFVRHSMAVQCCIFDADKPQITKYNSMLCA